MSALDKHHEEAIEHMGDIDVEKSQSTNIPEDRVEVTEEDVS